MFTQELARFDQQYLQSTDWPVNEFHHWDSTDNGDSCLAVKPDGKRRWQCIHMKGNLMAGYPHLYYRSHPELVERYVKACAEYSEKGTRR